ncbi:hypothetical protein [Thermincola potens]|nr:hypothetical protein [Thermincola potens]
MTVITGSRVLQAKRSNQFPYENRQGILRNKVIFMLNIRDYLEDIHHILSVQSPAQFKMFIYRYMPNDPRAQYLLSLDRNELKLYVNRLKKQMLPWIEESLEIMSDDPLH